MPAQHIYWYLLDVPGCGYRARSSITLSQYLPTPRPDTCQLSVVLSKHHLHKKQIMKAFYSGNIFSRY
ncbi:hypothetical protein BofuT4_uP042790.1 [Botrytis cinerea T4]|uniref:Uncharacterized protein n=1 Tax=Botryotinia fuckeliana (strain T4) TaxID=999810 RepID=G2Y1X8_BOTF4|nr:hypothetical protein BofuT4_uP042790.1 [Botrytis cinerea T4]